jgi:hypothetical protein
MAESNQHEFELIIELLGSLEIHTVTSRHVTSRTFAHDSRRVKRLHSQLGPTFGYIALLDRIGSDHWHNENRKTWS